MRLITRADWDEALRTLGVRAKITVHPDGVVLMRVVDDAVILLREWIGLYRPAGVCIFVGPGLHWWECLWTRVQWQESDKKIGASAVMRMAQREAGSD